MREGTVVRGTAFRPSPPDISRKKVHTLVGLQSTPHAAHCSLHVVDITYVIFDVVTACGQKLEEIQLLPGPDLLFSPSSGEGVVTCEPQG